MVFSCFFFFFFCFFLFFFFFSFFFLSFFVLSFFFFFFFKQKTAYEMQRGLVGSEMCIRDSYRTESININGGMATKIVSMFSQISKDQIELDIFDFKSLSVSKNIDNPFKEVNRAYGAILDSYILSGAFHLTAMAAIEDEKGRTHLKVSQYHFGW
eukprot:TRINITY_DN4516_c0_g1_i3.p2 TRINITY_DN4516_c0_g1~~TRINITY_DN4516_c0_g1_i3.p2  ORF type:complete len:169 (-),score=52.64 TRINITY_DN4516_c0_g1_i3:210-674(-)